MLKAMSIEGNENKMCMKIMDDLSENPAARKWSCNKQRYKKVRFFTCPKTFFIWAGIDFPLHDDDKYKDDEEEKEEEEEEEDEEEVNVTNKYK